MDWVELAQTGQRRIRVAPKGQDIHFLRDRVCYVRDAAECSAMVSDVFTSVSREMGDTLSRLDHRQSTTTPLGRCFGV